MCGIVGIIHYGQKPNAPCNVRDMAASIIHRGPDDDGFWNDDDIALGFRRLSIVDLKNGAQPMANKDGSIFVVFNGEIYNHRELRQELTQAGHHFTTDHSDTEVLVHGYAEWGKGLLTRLNGMFAFVLWDVKRRAALIARDRLGIKPLYLADTDHGLVFSSEIRGLHASDIVEKKANMTGVLEYFSQQNVWLGRSMFAGVRQLLPGTFLEITPDGQAEETFWTLNFNRKNTSMNDAAERLRYVLAKAMDRQLIADVPVYTYLSGGIDSSSITARARAVEPKMRAYSCIFDLDGVGEDAFVDERVFARAIAKELNIDHVELELPQKDLIDSLQPTISALEEPAMGMAYVNWRIAERVAADGKVVLSGCGGDEILGGYVGRYAYVNSQLETIAARKNRSFIQNLLNRFRNTTSSFNIKEPLLALYHFPVAPTERSIAFTPEFLQAADDYRVEDSVDKLLSQCTSNDALDQLMYCDIRTYLTGLLMVEDKLSMTHSLEARVPLLDNEVIDAALQLPWEVLTDFKTGKMAFRNAIRDWVPEIVADKPKMGFGPPDASWYRGGLQDFVREMLSPQRIEARGIFQPAYVSTAIEQHMQGTANKLPLIWSLLSFEAWCKEHGLFGGATTTI